MRIFLKTNDQKSDNQQKKCREKKVKNRKNWWENYIKKNK